MLRLSTTITVTNKVTRTMAIVIDKERLRAAVSDRVVLRIKMTHGLLFCLARVSKSNKQSITSTITGIFLRYYMKNEYTHRRTSVNQTSQFVKYFRDFWPYPLKNKIK